MYKSQKDIDDWIKAFNKREVKRMKKDKYKGYEDLNFRGGGEWGLELHVPQAILDLLPEEERKNWWEVGVVIDDDGEGICQDEEEALEEFGVKDIDDINAIFCRRFYEGMSDEDEEWWSSLEVEIKGKTGQPFEEVRISG
tara:strand:- start:104 stop:523 length:420 start_codon:yes stop_codon:yes gene_type:complete